MEQMFTPQALFEQLQKTIIGQDEYLKALSNAAFLHNLRYQHFMNTSELIVKPKQNLLVIGGSGSGKTLALETLGKLLNLPVIIEDASAMSGEGWKGRSVSNITTRVNSSTDRAEDRIFSIIVFDEIDKVFRSNRTNHSGTADSGFLPLNNLLTFLAGGSIMDKDTNIVMDTSNFLTVCVGAFEGLDKIIKKRLSGDRKIGFKSSEHKDLSADEDILQYVTDEDLHEFGVPWELLGRISTIKFTRRLGEDDFARILKHSEASPVRQYNSLLSKTSDIRVSITDAAVKYIAAQAGKTKEGARMLARIVSDILQPDIFDIGNDLDISGVEIDCSNGELCTINEYDMYTANPEQDDADLFVSEHPAYLSIVPLPCNRNRGDILLFTEKLKKSSKLSWMLPEPYVSATTCIIAAAICSQLEYAGSEDKNLLTLYRQIDRLPTKCIPRPASHLERMINEFIQKAQKDMDFEKAKSNAKRFIVDYCRNYSYAQEQFSA